MIKLNMGCGSHLKEGYVNVDKYPPANVVCDLDKDGWPWVDGTIDEVLFHHSLEHMGQQLDGFLHIMKELYRVCCNDAKINIVVPHYRHDDYVNDPTHVRIVTPMILELFSKKNNELWAKDGAPNTPLALQLGVDFELLDCAATLDPIFRGYPEAALKNALLTQNNVIKQYAMVMKVIK